MSETPHRRRRPRPDAAASKAAKRERLLEGDPTNRADPTRRQRRADRKRSNALASAAMASGSSATAAAAGGADRAARMRAFRLPALLMVIALIAGGFALQNRVTAPIEETLRPTDLSRLMPTAAASSSLSSTWFCAGGTARGPEGGNAASSATTTTTAPKASDARPSDARPPGARPADARPPVIAEHTVVMANAGDQAQAVRVTVYPSDGQPVLRALELAPRARVDLPLAEVVKAPFASAVVETDGGLIAVEHTVQGPSGRSVSPCASSPSANWYFPAGTTRLGTREFFVAFNPFPQQSVLDFGFQVEEEGTRQASRDSNKLKGIVVPPNGVVAVEVTDIITVRNQMSTTVQTRLGEGRVVVDRLIVADGTNNQPKSLSNTLGAPAPAPSWLFADGPALEPGVVTTYALYNPGSETVDADVMVQPDSLAAGADVQPFAVTVRAGQYATVEITKDSRVPSNTGYWVVVQSRRGAIVAERVTRSDAPAARPGVAYSMGSPLVASRWMVPIAGLTGQKVGQVAIANVAVSSSVTLTARVAGNGSSEVLTAFDRVELGAGRRTVVDLTSLGRDGGDPTAFIDIEASGPVVVEQVFGFSDPASVSDVIAIPVRGSLAEPPAELAYRSGSANAPGTPGRASAPGSSPSGSSPPGSVPAGSIPPGPASGTVAPTPATDLPPPVGVLPTGPDGIAATTTTTTAGLTVTTTVPGA